MTTSSWVNAALRSIVWLGAVAWLAYLKKPDGGSILAVRADAIGWLGAGLLVAGLAFHIWSNVSLARGEDAGGPALSFICWLSTPTSPRCAGDSASPMKSIAAACHGGFHNCGGESEERLILARSA